MAFYCPDCNLVFDRKRNICPKCGYGLASDSNSIDHYTEIGYSLFSSANTIVVPENKSKNTDYNEHITINNSAIEDKLVKEYYSIINKNNQENAKETIHTPQNNTAKHHSQPPKTSKQASESANESHNFFEQYSNYTPHTQTESSPHNNITPQVDSVASNDSNSERPSSETYRNPIEGNDYEQERRRIIRSYRRRRFFSGLGNGFLNFRWDIFFRLLPFILVVVGIIVIWLARDAILRFLINFITALIPLILIIAGIVWVIRSIFR